MKKTGKNRKEIAGGNSTFVQRNTVFVSVVTAFITTFMGSALNLSIPAIDAEFEADAKSVGWIITLYMLTCAALAVPFGRLADQQRRRLILCLGILLFGASSGAAMFADDLRSLLWWRLFQGVGAAMIFSTNIAILVSAFAESRRGQILGYVTCANYIGLSAGPVLGGVLNDHFGWRSVFACAAVVSAVAFYAALTRLAKPEREAGFSSRPPFDLQGSLLYIGGIVGLMYGLSVVTTTRYGWLILLLGACLLFAFGRTELSAEAPVVKLQMFRQNSVYTCGNLAAMMNYGANFAISYLLSLYLQVIMGYSAQTAGFFLILAPGVQALLSPLMGRLSDKHSPQIMSALGMAVCAAAQLIFAFLPAKAPLPLLLGALALSGAGFALFATPNTNGVMAAVKKEEYGVASSLLATMRSLGHTTSMAIITVLVSLYLGRESLNATPPAQLLQTMHSAFLVFAGICILGILVALKRKT